MVSGSTTAATRTGTELDDDDDGLATTGRRGLNVDGDGTMICR